MKDLSLILASASPRRNSLLALLEIPFQVMPSRAAERFHPGVAAGIQAKRLALEKAREVARRLKAGRQSPPKNCWILGADTIVAKGGKLLAKPRDAAHAASMLRLLSGTSHEVITGMALLPLDKDKKAWAHAERTKVWFRKLDEAEIDDYVRSGEPLDKAGAYGIQGRAGAFVKKISGDYFNVVGLPLASLAQKLRSL